MSALDFDGLDLRRDLEVVREAVAAELDEKRSPEGIFRTLADRDPVALAELVVGPRALGGPGVVRAALEVAETLESSLAPAALYRRLLDLSPGAAGEDVLREAAARHPLARWIVELSARVEGDDAGYTHLFVLAWHPAFGAACQAHAQAGHVGGLVKVAGALGRPEPAAALASCDHAAGAAEAAARALDLDPHSPVVAWLAAVWGPDLDPLLVRMIPFLRDPAAVRAVAAGARGFPRTSALLEVIMRGLQT